MWGSYASFGTQSDDIDNSLENFIMLQPPRLLIVIEPRIVLTSFFYEVAKTHLDIYPIDLMVNKAPWINHLDFNLGLNLLKLQIYLDLKSIQNQSIF